MSENDINLERFAHDVCVHTLEKFGNFKAPDDTRKQNKYASFDFLPCVSRSVVSYAICMRERFKKVLEAKYEIVIRMDNEKMWNFFDALAMSVFGSGDCFEKVYITLALCTEYIQFMNRKGHSVSLNKVVILWRDFFDGNVGKDFDKEGGFLKFDSLLKRSCVDQLDKFHKAFISNYCLPYGSKDCTEEIAKECAKIHGISLIEFVPQIGLPGGMENLFAKVSEERATPSEASQINPGETEVTKLEETNEETSDSEDSDSSTDTSEDSESSQNIRSSESLVPLSQNNLLGIPPHEDVLREIDPFFVENIPSPPKPRSASKSPEREVAESENLEQLQETVEQILSRLESDMEALKTLLLEHGLIATKSGRRGSRMRIKDTKDNFPPRGPEGLI